MTEDMEAMIELVDGELNDISTEEKVFLKSWIELMNDPDSKLELEYVKAMDSLKGVYKKMNKKQRIVVIYGLFDLIKELELLK